MADLRTLYKELLDSPEEVLYYKGVCACFDNLFLCNGSEEFIRNILTKGEKKELKVFTENIDELSSMRKKHMVSCYFLGILIYNNNEWIRNKIDNQIKSLNSNITGEEPNKKFCYLWMLICLFHDLGYTFEENSSDIKKNIPYIIPKKRTRNIVPKIYTPTLIRKYWSYRRCRWQVEDHGISGGFRFYSDICKLREQMFAQMDEDEDPCKKNRWDEALENDFACAAWIIACHNIFTTKEGSEYECCYKHYGLDKLITKDYIIVSKKHPILFLFCLVDSIEPIKVLGDYSYFEKIDFCFNIQDQIELEINRLPKQLRKKVKNVIKGLNEWLTKIDENDNKLIINLKISQL